jgi:PAS domain S-box-containing protein
LIWISDYCDVPFKLSNAFKHQNQYAATSILVATHLLSCGAEVSMEDYISRRADDQTYFLAKMFDAIRMSIIATRPDGEIIYWNLFAEELYGWQCQEILGRNIMEIMVPAEDMRSARDIFACLNAGEAWTGEFTVKRKDGSRLRVAVADSPIFSETGDLIGIVGVSHEVTALVQEPLESSAVSRTHVELKAANKDLSELAARLMRLREEERTSLAQELHKYLDCLVLISLSLDRLDQNRSQSWAEMKRGMGEARQEIERLFTDIQILSHRLRSSKLEYLGLVAAAASFCKEFSDQENIQIGFASEGVPKELPQEISLALFYVLQEALQNATHTGSQRVQVLLKGRPDEITLMIDWGNGFKPKEILKGAGLIILEERMKMVGGALRIESGPQPGTTIHARVPL